MSVIVQRVAFESSANYSFNTGSVKNDSENDFDITEQIKGRFYYKNRQDVYSAPRQEVETSRNLPLLSQHALVVLNITQNVAVGRYRVQIPV